MFNQSTQRKFWIFESPESIQEAQINANQNFLEKRRKLNQNHTSEYLKHKEESVLRTYYSQFVFELCRKFRPPVPTGVIGTSLAYFKRFYLNTSVMEFHPYHVAFLSVYLACKVDEYTVSIDQFMSQVSSSPSPQIHMFVIDNELLMIQKLNFHLTVHSPFRPLEGLIIDLKTKSDAVGLSNIEQYRPQSEKFLFKSLLTDVCLLYTPSQIAMTALYVVIGKPFLGYLRLISNDEVDMILPKLEAVKSTILNFRFPSEGDIKAIDAKSKMCLDPENDPFSEHYHERDKSRKEAKEQQKKKKYQELCEMQETEYKMLANVSDGE